MKLNKAEFIAKTINNKRGYKYYTYRTEFNDDIVKLFHYGSHILTFSIEKKLDNGLYAQLGQAAHSFTDICTIRICLRHVFDSKNIFYEICRVNSVFTPTGKLRKFFKAYYELLDKNDFLALIIKKPKNQYTLFNYEPFISMRKQIEEEIANRKLLMLNKLHVILKEQLRYLESFTTDKRITFDPKRGYILNLPGKQILITFDGSVIDLEAKTKICIQPKFVTVHPYRYLHFKLKPVDLMIMKALGILNRPQVLKEGIQTKLIKEIDPDPYDLVRNDYYDDTLALLTAKLNTLKVTKVYDYKSRNRRYIPRRIIMNGSCYMQLALDDFSQAKAQF